MKAMIPTHRLKITVAAGAILGLVCILGAWVRSGFEKEAVYLFAFWYNRLLMGLVIGFAGGVAGLAKAIIRGAIIGLLVSFAFFSSTGFSDPLGFAAGIMYGIIIEYAGLKYGTSVKR